MSKSPDAFRTISEVADWLGVQAHVLRFWESKFNQIKPVKRAGGRRYYRPNDMLLLGGIKRLLHDDGLTIKGVQKILREQGVAHVVEMSKSLLEGNEPAEATGPDLRAVPDPDGSGYREFGSGSLKPDKAAGDDLFSNADRSEPALPKAAGGCREDAAPREQDSPEAVWSETAIDRSPAAASMPPFLRRPAQPSPASPATSPQSGTGAPSSTTRTPDEAPPVGRAPSADSVPPPELPRAAEPAPQETPPEPPSPRPHVVEAPDPPSEARLPYSPGVLAQLAQMDRVTSEQAAQLAPLAQDLRDWLAGNAASGAA